MKNISQGKMKILSINTHASQGGAARIAGTIHRFLMSQPESDGVSSEMIVGWGEDDPLNHIFPVYEGQLSKSINAAWFRLTGRENGFLTRKTSKKIRSMLEVADLIHIHNLHGYYVPLDILQLLEDKPVVWTLHDFWIATGRCAYPLDCTSWMDHCTVCQSKFKYPGSVIGNYRKIYQKKLGLILKLNKLTLTAPSRSFCNELAGYGLGANDLRVIYNGVDTNIFKPVDDLQRNAILSEMNIPNDQKKMFCFVASQINDVRKGMKYISQAMEWLEYPARFIVIGNKSGAEQMLSKKNRHEIIFTGFLSEKTQVAKWLKVADYFINPSISETFGLTNLESLSCGTRPIVFRLPVFQETLSDWGIFVEKLGGKEFAERINEVMASKTSSEIRSAAHQYVFENFSEERMCRNYLSLYKEMTGPTQLGI
jgi:putative colanic acid biosynthesis glycosyltransferase